MNREDNYIPTVVESFSVDGNLINTSSLGEGHINDTYRLTFETNKVLTNYTLQRINHEVFSDPESLMNNMARVTGHIRKKLEEQNATDINRKVMTLVPTSKGDFMTLDENGNYWRLYVFIDNAETYNEPRSPDQAYQAAKAFGQFQASLSDLPAPPSC